MSKEISNIRKKVGDRRLLLIGALGLVSLLIIVLITDPLEMVYNGGGGEPEPGYAPTCNINEPSDGASFTNSFGWTISITDIDDDIRLYMFSIYKEGGKMRIIRSASKSDGTIVGGTNAIFETGSYAPIDGSGKYILKLEAADDANHYAQSSEITIYVEIVTPPPAEPTDGLPISGFGIIPLVIALVIYRKVKK